MTGSRGPISKSPEQRQRRNKTPLAIVPIESAKSAKSKSSSSSKTKIPTAPEGLRPATRSRWKTFWESPLAARLQEIQVPMVERLFQRYDERDRTYQEVRKQGRVSKGSRGQLVLNPLMRYLDKCDEEIGRLEDRLGLSIRGGGPNANPAGGKEPDSLDDMNARLETDDDDTDPRLAASR